MNQAVLIVEDDALIRETIAEMFRGEGYVVGEDETAEGAITLLEDQDAVDLVVTDIQLAGEMTGLELAHWVVENRPSTQVLAISGFPQMIVRSSKPSRYSFLQKPFVQAELMEMANFLLSERGKGEG